MHNMFKSTLCTPLGYFSLKSVQYKERAAKLASSLGTLLTEKTRARAEALRRLPAVSGIAWEFTSINDRIASQISASVVVFSN